MELVPYGKYQLGFMHGIGVEGALIFGISIIMSVVIFYMIYITVDSIQKENRFDAIFSLFALAFFIPFNAAMYAWSFNSKPIYTTWYSVQITKDTDIYRLSQEYEITGISDGAIMVIAKEDTNEATS